MLFEIVFFLDLIKQSRLCFKQLNNFTVKIVVTGTKMSVSKRKKKAARLICALVLLHSHFHFAEVVL